MAQIEPKISPATVIAIAEFSADLLREILDILGNIDRKIAIGLGNQTTTSWDYGGVYYVSGTSDGVIPEKVPDGYIVLYNGRKTNGPVATGSVGVMGYRMSDGNTVALMFSVPFDYNLYSNWWNAKVYKGYHSIDEAMFNEMYYGNDPFKGDDAWHEKDIGEGYFVKGVMGSSGTCTLEVYIRKD